MQLRVRGSLGEWMGNVAASFKIYPDDPKANDRIKDAVGKFAHIQYAKEEEVGFGIKILRLTILLDDSRGGTEKVEDKIRSIPHVSQVEVEQVTLV